MSLMFPPTEHRATAVAPITIERRFRVATRCHECAREAVTVVALMDEPDDPATVDDFYGCGAVHHLDRFCARCGGEGFTILSAHYIRQPTDV